MEMIHHIMLDLKKNTMFEMVEAKQCDEGSRFICVTLTDDGCAYTPPVGTSARFRCVKPDGKLCDIPAQVREDGTVLLELTAQVLAVPGIVKGDVVLTDLEADTLSTATFTILVGEIPQGENIVSESEILTFSSVVAEGQAMLSKSQILYNEMKAAQESGELKGEKGDTGPQGEKGDKGEKGDTGTTGPQGPAGAVGKTPVRGTDYWTEEDKAEIIAAAKASVTEIWTFTLEDGSTVEKAVHVG